MAEMRDFADKHLRRVGVARDSDGILPIELAERIVRDRDRYDLVYRPARTFRLQQANPNSPTRTLQPHAPPGNSSERTWIIWAPPSPAVPDLPDAATLAAIHQDLANAARIERDRQSDAPVMSVFRN